jgi:hypothetical protein
MEAMCRFVAEGRHQGGFALVKIDAARALSGPIIGYGVGSSPACGRSAPTVATAELHFPWTHAPDLS